MRRRAKFVLAAAAFIVAFLLTVQWGVPVPAEHAGKAFAIWLI